MRLALVPLVRASGPYLGGAPVLRPDLPAELDGRYGQASSLWTPQGMVLVWLDVDESEALDLARRGVGVIDRYVRWTRADHAAMRQTHPRTQDLLDASAAVRRELGTTRIGEALRARRVLHRDMCAQSLRPTRDCLAAYREVAEAVEREHLGDPGPGIFGLTLLHADTFNRSNRALSGDAMSDGLGTWATTDATNPQIVSNEAATSVNGVTRHAYDSVMSAVDAQRASVTRPTTGPDCGPTTRMQSATQGYWLDGSAGVIYLFKENSGLSLLGSGGAFVANDVIALDSDANAHTGLVNGSVSLGPVSDSSYTTGKAGFATYTSTSRIDNWQVEVADSVSTYTATAALTTAPATTAVSATSDPPTFSASAALAAAPTTLSAAGTTDPPTFSGSAALVAAPATLAAEGATDPPTFSGTAALVAGPATSSSTATATPPTFTATAALSAAAAVLAASATYGTASAVFPSGGLRAREGYALRAREGYSLRAREG